MASIFHFSLACGLSETALPFLRSRRERTTYRIYAGIHPIPSSPRRPLLDQSDAGSFFHYDQLSATGYQPACQAGHWPNLLESIRFREERGDWYWRIFLAMPDHLHGIVTFPQRFFLRKSIAAWKRWIATQHSIIWQDGFFDHRLRNQESAVEKAGYIRLNPVRAGLVKHPHQWPYVRDWKKEA